MKSKTPKEARQVKTLVHQHSLQMVTENTSTEHICISALEVAHVKKCPQKSLRATSL